MHNLVRNWNKLPFVPVGKNHAMKPPKWATIRVTCNPKHAAGANVEQIILMSTPPRLGWVGTKLVREGKP
jgi:hypothetical protein